jgi:hypothetical protein
MKMQYGLSNSNYVALQLYEQLLDDPNLSADLREKSLFMSAQVLFNQWELFPALETIAIHPPPGVVGNKKVAEFQNDDSIKQRISKIMNDVEAYVEYGLPSLIYDTQVFTEGLFLRGGFSPIKDSIKYDYQQRIDIIIDELKNNFPTSSYIDDLLFSSYFFSNDKDYLTDIVDDFPDGDRYFEAVFLLNQPNSQ